MGISYNQTEINIDGVDAGAEGTAAGGIYAIYSGSAGIESYSVTAADMAPAKQLPIGLYGWAIGAVTLVVVLLTILIANFVPPKKAKKARESEKAAAEIKIEDSNAMTTPADNDLPAGPPILELGGTSSPVNPCPCELFSEIENNAAIAKAPRNGKILHFQTDIWDGSLSAASSLPAGTMEVLNEAYSDMRLANRLAWLCEVVGHTSQEMVENYSSLCANIAERLNEATSSVISEREQDSKLEQTFNGEPEENHKTDESAFKGEAAKITAGTKVDETDDQIFRGATRLFITRGAHSTRIIALKRCLSETANIEIVSCGGSSKEGPWLTLSLDRPLPLLKILREMPAVSRVSKRLNGIEVTLMAYNDGLN